MAGFQELRKSGETFANSVIKLAADITIDKDKYPWPDVSVDYPFKGEFDGQNYTVSGLYMTTTDSYGGMFSALGNGAKIHDLTIKDSSFSGVGSEGKSYHSLGSIAGAISESGAQVTIEKVTSYATVEGSNGFSYVGGLIGQINAPGDAVVTMNNCIFSGSVAITDTGDYAGGIVGYITNSSVTVNLTQCSNTGTGNITVAKMDGVAGDIVGYANKAKEVRVKGCTCSGEWIGGMNATQVEAGNLTVTSVYGGEPDTSWCTDTAGTYTLMTAEELMGFQMLRAGNVGNEMKTFEGYTIKLGVNVVINEGTMNASTDSSSVVSWPNLADKEKDYPFKGTFDGQNHTISGIYMDVSNSNKGMFGALGNGAIIQNFTLNNSYFSGTASKQSLGSIAGTISENGAQVTIYNVTSNATLVGSEGYNYVGGLIGLMDAGISVETKPTVNMNKCCFGGTITVSGTGDTAGGIIGRVTNSNITVNLTECISTGSITRETTSSGGAGDIIGYANKGAITLTDCTGTGADNEGLVGGKKSATITYNNTTTE